MKSALGYFVCLAVVTAQRKFFNFDVENLEGLVLDTRSLLMCEMDFFSMGAAVDLGSILYNLS